jgi:hypothetical protein
MFTWFYFQLLGGGGTLEMNIDGGVTLDFFPMYSSFR